MTVLSDRRGAKRKKLEASGTKTEDKMYLHPKTQLISNKCEKYEAVEKSKVARNKQRSSQGSSKRKSHTESLLGVNENKGTKTNRSQKTKGSRLLKDCESSFVNANEATLKNKEKEFRRKCESWQLTREDVTSVPTLIKPTIKPIDENEISVMAEKMMKEMKGKRNSINQQLKNSETCEGTKTKKTKKVKRIALQPSKQQSRNGTSDHESNKSKNAIGSKKERNRDIGNLLNGKNDKKKTTTNLSKEIQQKLEEATYTENQKSPCAASENTACRPDDETLENTCYEGKSTTSFEQIKHNPIFVKQEEFAEKSSKSLKSKKSGFSVPLKCKGKVAASAHSILKTPDKEPSRQTKQELLHNVGSSQGSEVESSIINHRKKGRPIKGIHDEFQQFQCRFTLNDHNCNVSSKVGDSHHHDHMITDFTSGKQANCHCSKGDLSEFDPAADREKDFLDDNVNRDDFKCVDGGDQSLDEIISFHEASEIISESFAAESPNIKKRIRDQNCDKSSTLSTEKHASPLVPRNVTENMQLSRLFKSEPVEFESKLWKFDILFQKSYYSIWLALISL